MRHPTILALALALTTAAATAPAGAETAAPVPTIAVTGEGRVEGAPDIATLTLGVTTQKATAAAALAANSEAVARVLARLAEAGIAPADLQTTGLSVSPNWSGYDSGSTPRIADFTAQNLVTVRVRALDGLGAVLDAAVADGANTLNGLSFGLADPAPALAAARARAVEDARARAEVLAQAAGVSLGPVLSITEAGGSANPAPMFRAEALAASVPVAGGEVSVGVAVTVVWAIAGQ
jgi:hypothetical protein